MLQYLALCAAQQYRPTTLRAIVRTLNALRHRLTGIRRRILTADLTQTTPQDITAFITVTQASGLAPTTINTQLGMLRAFFAHLRDDGQMAQQPVRRYHRLATPLMLPKPIPDADLVAFFQVIDAVGRVPQGCGYCFGPSPKPSERGQAAGDHPSKPVFKTPSTPLDLHLSTLSP